MFWLVTTVVHHITRSIYFVVPSFFALLCLCGTYDKNRLEKITDFVHLSVSERNRRCNLYRNTYRGTQNWDANKVNCDGSGNAVLLSCTSGSIDCFPLNYLWLSIIYLDWMHLTESKSIRRVKCLAEGFSFTLILRSRRV